MQLKKAEKGGKDLTVGMQVMLQPTSGRHIGELLVGTFVEHTQTANGHAALTFRLLCKCCSRKEMTFGVAGLGTLIHVADDNTRTPVNLPGQGTKLKA